MLEADACILAIGQKADLSFLTAADGVALTPAGTIRIDPATLATSAAGIYAGGDVAFGPRNLIDAVANGKRAARSIHEHLAGQDARIETHLEVEALVSSRYRMAAGFERFDREAPPTLDLGRRTGITEVETGYDAEAARIQAARCLVCHVQTIYDPERCVLCNRCVDVCPEYCLAFVPLDALDLDPRERARPSKPAPMPTGSRSPRSSRTTSAASAAGCAPSAARPRPSPWNASLSPNDGCLSRRPLHRIARHERAPRATDRRDFLLKLGTGAGVAAITVQAGASLRSLVPNVSYDAPTTVKLGPPTEFPDGLKFLPDERVLVFREGNTFHAISAVCTHLGCTVRAEPLANPQTIDDDGAALRLTHRFLCPCHGSRYRGRRH